MTPTVSNASGLLSFNNGETVENRGLGFPFVESSPIIVNSSLKSCFISTFSEDFATSVQERREDIGVNVGARTFKGISGTGGNSEIGTGSTGTDMVGSDIGTSLEGDVELEAHVVTNVIPRGRLSLVPAHDLLGRGLGCVEKRWPRTYLTLAGS